MTNEERAEKLIDIVHTVPTYREAKEAILAYADEIRRECAEKATGEKYGKEKENATWYIAYNSGIDSAIAAIMGKEAGE